MGFKGFAVNEDINIDFTVATQDGGTERIIRAALEFAKRIIKQK